MPQALLVIIPHQGLLDLDLSQCGSQPVDQKGFEAMITPKKISFFSEMPYQLKLRNSP